MPPPRTFEKPIRKQAREARREARSPHTPGVQEDRRNLRESRGGRREAGKEAYLEAHLQARQAAENVSPTGTSATQTPDLTSTLKDAANNGTFLALAAVGVLAGVAAVRNTGFQFPTLPGKFHLFP